jgi:hypothetical protein
MNFKVLENLINMDKHIEDQFKRFFATQEVLRRMEIDRKSIDDMIVICSLDMINKHYELSYIYNNYGDWFKASPYSDEIFITFLDRDYNLIDFGVTKYE